MRRYLLLLSGALAFVPLMTVAVLVRSPTECRATSLIVTNDGPTILGQSTTLTATAGGGFSYAWSLGDGASTTGPVVTHLYQAAGVYTAVVTATSGAETLYGSTTVLVDTPISGEVLEEGFEGEFPPPGWLSTIQTPASIPWSGSTARVHGGAQGAFHDDIHIGEYGRQDAWLVTPCVTPTVESELVFWQNENYAPHYLKHSIWISAQCQDPKECSFSQLAEVGPGSEDTWEEVRIDLAAYAGQSVYLAFRYEGTFSDQEDCTDEWYVDDVQVTSALLASHDGPKAPGQAVTLAANATIGSNVHYAWAFGDGQAADGAVVAHAYAAIGDYTAVVTASNSINTVTRTLLVPIRILVYVPLTLRDF